MKISIVDLHTSSQKKKLACQQVHPDFRSHASLMLSLSQRPHTSSSEGQSSPALSKILFPAQAANPTNHLPRVVCKTLTGLSLGSRKAAQSWFLRAGFWERLLSLMPVARTVPARTCGPTHASLTHYCILLLGRHRHAEPTSSQQWKPGVSTDSSTHRAQVQEPYSWARAPAVRSSSEPCLLCEKGDTISKRP